MGIQVGETGEFPGGRRPSGRALNIVSPRRQKPLLPVENPFPEKKEFRLGIYTLIEEKDDYLICKGFDPNTKNPAAEYTPPAHRTIKVAKPPLLQKTGLDGQTLTIGGIDYSYEYDAAEVGIRTVTWTENSEELVQEQRIATPYFVDEPIVAVEIRESIGVDGIDVESEEGGRLSWMDLNVSGRHWELISATIVGTLNGNLAEDGSATITVTEGPDGQMEVHERMGLGDNDPLTAGAYVTASWVDGLGYSVVGTGCPS